MPLRRDKNPKKIPGPPPCGTCGGARWVTKGTGKGRARILCPGCNGSGTTEPKPAPDKL